jgi:hypothetical protein
MKQGTKILILLSVSSLVRPTFVSTASGDLALNQATEKGNVLRRVQQVREPAACTEEFQFTAARSASTCGRRIRSRRTIPARRNAGCSGSV